MLTSCHVSPPWQFCIDNPLSTAGTPVLYRAYQVRSQGATGIFNHFRYGFFTLQQMITTIQFFNQIAEKSVMGSDETVFRVWLGKDKRNKHYDNWTEKRYFRTLLSAAPNILYTRGESCGYDRSRKVPIHLRFVADFSSRKNLHINRWHTGTHRFVPWHMQQATMHSYKTREKKV